MGTRSFTKQRGSTLKSSPTPLELLTCGAGACLIVVLLDNLSFEILLFTLLAYSMLLFVVICDFLKVWFAGVLNRKRGEKWIKEMDYIYMLLGSVGILGAINRMDR